MYVHNLSTSTAHILREERHDGYPILMCGGAIENYVTASKRKQGYSLCRHCKRMSEESRRPGRPLAFHADSELRGEIDQAMDLLRACTVHEVPLSSFLKWSVRLGLQRLRGLEGEDLKKLALAFARKYL